MRIYRTTNIKKSRLIEQKKYPQSLIWSTSAKIKEPDITGYFPSKEYQLIKKSSQTLHQAKNKLVERENRGTSDNGRSYDFCNTLLNSVNPREAIAVLEKNIRS
ncbi:MAG: hypothetical protein H5T39_01940 [Methanobacteriales archaeon]|nr:hypothetical protein [Methanobacteriaceae archaeon]MBC7096444.1 hypothetical protein [Methanobacteriales archaeon]